MSGFNASAIDSHPQKRKITDMLLTGKSLRDIRKAIDPKVSLDTLNRFKKRTILPALDRLVAQIQVDNPNVPILPPSQDEPVKPAPNTSLVPPGVDIAELSKELAIEASTNPVIRRLASKFKKIDDMLEYSHSERDFGGFAAVLNADTRQMQLLARLRGDLASDDHGANSVQVNVIIPEMARRAAESATNSDDRATQFGPRGENLLPGDRVVTVDLPKK